jgi:outer membrane protein TolC
MVLCGFLTLGGLTAGWTAAQADRPELRLSLAECLRTALESNLDLRAAKKNPEIARQSMVIEETAFDSTLSAEAGYGRQSTDTTFSDPSGSRETDSEVDLLSGAVRWGQKVTFGADYSLGLRASETDPSPTARVDPNLGFTTISDNLFDSSALEFTYTMPLLQGFGTEVNTAAILLARSGLDVSAIELEARAQEILKGVEDGYWDLLAAQAAVKVAGESLKLARDLLDLNRKKVEVGTLAPIEIVQAEAGVASREEGVILAEAGVDNAEDNLRFALGYPQGDPAWSARLVPTDQPLFSERAVDLDAALATALAERPEIAVARRQLEDARLSERVAENGVRHRLDLNVGAARGLDDAEIRTTIVGVAGVTRVDQEDRGFDWQVGLTYAYPLGNRAAKANRAVATLNREKYEIDVLNVEQGIRVDVRTAVRNVESGAKRVQAARASAVLQRRTLEAEQKKFENGMSTSFEVLRIQTDLSDAQLAEIRAVLDYNKALADLERAQGTLLEARGLVLEVPEATR